jgi:hypothetical protein
LTWNTSIVANFCFACSTPICRFVIASFTPTLLACWLLVSFLLAICYMSPTCYPLHIYYFLRLRLLSPAYLLPPSPPTCFHTLVQVPNTCLPSLLFAYFEFPTYPPTWYFPLTYLPRRWSIEGMCINL